MLYDMTNLKHISAGEALGKGEKIDYAMTLVERVQEKVLRHYEIGRQFNSAEGGPEWTEVLAAAEVVKEAKRDLRDFLAVNL